MAHRVRVLHNPTQKTIRMHYANCNTYNADFDGDEMNCHYPQNDLARVEAQYLAQTDLQYIVPTDGSPLRGLIQDHVVGGVKMTKKDTFFTKWEYQQLLFAALSSLPGLEVIRHDDKIETVPPAILKPCELWTGKQIITSILLHLRKGSDRDSAKLSNLPGLSMERQSKTPDTSFGVKQEEHLVLIRDGELLRGVLDKNAFGATSFSLVHCVYEAYGPEKAGLLLNVLGRLFTAYLQFYSGHSCRMEDLVLTTDADNERRKLIQRAYNLGTRAAKAWADSEGGKVTIPPIKDQPGADEPLKSFELASASKKLSILLSGNEGKENFAALDGFMQGQLNPLASDIVKKTLPIGLAVPFPLNTFGIMTTTGAKGSIVNQSQVSCALGQQALEGRRVPRMSSGRTLPSFAPYDPNPRADGFVMDRFLTGIRPQEYYFHCMAGREGLVDTAVKTSRSGYLQRCLVKHLEELKICYDFTVRNSEGNIIQFLYGEDGLDPIKASYLDCSTKSFEFMARNYNSLQRRNTALPSSSIDIAAKDFQRYSSLKDSGAQDIAVGDTVRARRLRFGQSWARGAICHGWSYATITNTHRKSKTVDLQYHSDGQNVRRVPIEVDLGSAGGKQTMALSSKTVLVIPCAFDPIISSVTRGHLLGSSGSCVSEQVAAAASKAISTNLVDIIKSCDIPREILSAIIGAKYSSSICSPGEAVGSIAAQSVGEPSTQMTLNTFHLAGAGANVTLGIPRLREIIMTASRTLKTPTLSVPLIDTISEKEAVRLARGFKKLTLMDLISGKRGVSVTERIEKGDTGGWLRAYYVTLKFHPAERILEAFGLSIQDIAIVVAKNYVPLLSQIMKKELKRSAVEDEGNIGDVVGGTSSECLDDVDLKTDEPTSNVDTDDINEDDNEEDDQDDVVGEEDGVEFGRKQNNSYDDVGNVDEIDGDGSHEVVEAFGQFNSKELEDPLYLDEKLNNNDAPTIQKRTNSIALQALKVEPSARPLLMVDLVEKAASIILVRSRKNIEGAFINEEPKRGRCLQTAGINFEEIWELDTVKHDELIANDIWAIRCAYGVEAARGSIMGQIRSVFGAYGIEVDPRHLSLIADYMTYDGGFKPMSRIGMEECNSTLLQMSFETTAHFLKKAAMSNKIDNLQSPSANIVLGRSIRHGTGAFSLLSKS
jgi:DNA-directed RNA polymerase I subunit RPA1